MKMTLLIVSLLFMVGIVNLAQAETFESKSVVVRIDGTSTLHDWTAPAEKAKANGDLTIINGELIKVNAMWVQVDVLSIKSEKGKDMDEKIYEALSVENHPTITFNVSSQKSIRKQESEYIIETVGELTIAGVKKNVDLTVKGTMQGNGDMVFKGSIKLLMSQYGMKRPTAMLGMIKCGDAVTVSFTLTMKKF
ncbi:MAG: YceI family protein [Candidatus Kapabacteria bacterium]|nr:YceI family protein [Candidatus Kapabacteria bacterium]